MNGHFATRRLLDDSGDWKNADGDEKLQCGYLSYGRSNASACGLSLCFETLPGAIKSYTVSLIFSINGSEVAFGTIGNASTSEGHFFRVYQCGGCAASSDGLVCLGR